jgi:hypothetical protein
VRFVARTTQPDYVLFRSSTGCSASIGRTGGRQSINLATGELPSSVLAVGIDRASGAHHYFYKRGFATSGSATNVSSRSLHFRYVLPAGKAPSDLVDVGFAANGHLFAWYTDGTVSEGTPTDLGKYAAPARFTLPAGKVVQDLAAVTIDGADVAYGFYKDGTLSRGTPKALGTSAATRFTVASGKTPADIASVGVSPTGTFQAFYSDGHTSTGTATSLGTGALAKLTFPSHCSTGSTIHEIGHTVGLFHEQARHDRDNFIRINWSNIQSGHSHNFNKYSTSTGLDLGAYDFGSIMHYSSTAFSANGQPTIVKKDGSTFSTQRTALSEGDIAALKRMYPTPPAAP